MKIKKDTKTGYYHVSYMAASGKTITRSLKTKSRKEAEMLAKEAKIEKIETAAKVDALTKDTIASIISDKNKPIEDVLSEYNKFRELKCHSVHSIYSEESNINKFIRDYDIKAISDITKEQIYDFANNQDKGSLAHRNKRITSVRGLISYAIANAYILVDPSYGVVVDKSKLAHGQKEKREQPPFNKRDYLKLRKHCPYFWSIACDFGWWTGLRMSDIAIMEWASFDGDHLIVHTLKTDTRIVLPLDDELIGGGILRDTIARIEPDDEKYCFPHWAWMYNNEKRRSTLPTYFARVLKRVHPVAYEEGKRFHSFRRAFVTRCKREGRELKDIAVMVGHSSTKTTEIYDAS